MALPPTRPYDAAKVKEGDYLLMKQGKYTRIGYVSEVGVVRMTTYHLLQRGVWSGPHSLKKAHSSVLGFIDPPPGTPPPPKP